MARLPAGLLLAVPLAFLGPGERDVAPEDRRAAPVPASATIPPSVRQERQDAHCLRLAGSAWRRLRDRTDRPLDARDTERLVDGLPPACRRALERR